MRSPFTGGATILLTETRIAVFRKEEYEYTYVCYKCVDTEETFTTTQMDVVNTAQIYNAYRAKHGIPFPDEIKEIRSRYELSASKMSKILGFGDNQYRLYENGEMPSLANGRVLKAIQSPKTFETFVDAAKETLDTAIEGLVLRADAETLAQLQAAADELRALGEKATDEQFGSAGDVLAAADEMLAKGAENISADEAKAMTADLQAAIDAVEKAIEEGETGDGGEDSDTPGGDTGDGSDDGADGNAPAAVQTGDAAPIMLYVFLAAGAAVTAVLAGRFRKVR